MGENNSVKPAMAERVPSVREFHGCTYVDNYAWMKNRKNPKLLEYVNAQNAYTEQRVKPLENLRSTLFNELRSRVQETDMSVPVRMNSYWYYVRTQEGKQYAVQCRMKVKDESDWNPPTIDDAANPGETPGEEVLFDANAEAERAGGKFFRLGGMDLSLDGSRMLYGVDTQGDERFTYYVRDFCEETSEWVTLQDSWEDLASASLTPDGKWVFYVRLDDSWRPYQVWRHRIGNPTSDDVKVFEEPDERFFVDVYESFDERYMMISSSSKTTSRVLMLPLSTPEGEFSMVIEPVENVEYDISFACFEEAGENGEDIPVAVVCHNAKNPNFEIDVIDMRNLPAAQESQIAKYSLGDGVCVASGSPYGCEQGDFWESDASKKPICELYDSPQNPEILRNTVGLSVSGLSVYKNYVALAYRAQGLPHLAVISKKRAAEDFLNGRPWRFYEIRPQNVLDCESTRVNIENAETAENAGSYESAGGAETAETAENSEYRSETQANSRAALANISQKEISNNRLFGIGMTGNPSYEAPRMRYAFGSYATLGQLREFNPSTGEDVLLKRGKILGEFDEHNYAEKRIWITARDGERVPVSLVWRPSAVLSTNAMFITGYGAYEVSSDPTFSVGRLSLLDRGVLYAQVHVRGGGEMGRAWYEQGRRRNKKHTFEDFVDATRALQDAGFASAENTVANGGSAGGLLMGAIANMAPECYAGIEADVPFVDALTSMLDSSLPLTVTEWDEWGNPLNNAEDYAYMKSYTPYENVPCKKTEDGCKKLANFPKILITSSMYDTRVLVTEPLKWLAALQNAGVDAIARIETDGGHGGTSGRYRQWKDLAYENAWCLHAMGIGN
ncbi:S9 family peptidase [Gardnerella vaginalis]|uniref:S9 family peptidase n=1 Tax=Gardnerella vaginalis TaxID=2702 RepID=UPI0039EE7063